MGRNTIHKTEKPERNAASAGTPEAPPHKSPAGRRATSLQKAPESPKLKSPNPKSTKPKSTTPKSAKSRSSKLKAAKPRPWTNAEIEEAFRRLREANPEPRGELEHINPFTLLVAVVLSAQATDAGVNKATKALFAVADTPAKMVELGEAKLRDYIKTIGLYNTKAKNVIALSEKLLAEHGGEVPCARAILETLPGVGRKTANVVLNVAFGEETFAVDTHVFRVGNRTGMAPGKTPLEVELKLEAIVPPEFRLHAHHWLILHGRYICKAQRPLCETCVINDLCRWPEKTTFMASG
jgi:endonuclease-3